MSPVWKFDKVATIESDGIEIITYHCSQFGDSSNTLYCEG